MANRYTGSDTGKSGLQITEVDGSPDVRGVSKIIVSDTTLTDDGGGTVTITTGGGGGGTPGGSDTQVQYNDAGAFAGSPGMTFASGSATLTATILSGTTLTDGTASLSAGALTGLTTPLTVAQGGTGASSITDGGIVLGSGTGAVTATAQPSDGQLLIGNSGNDPDLATVTNGAGIVITGGAGTLEVGVDEVLEDLDALGAPTADGEIIVATGAGAFAYETGDTALESLGFVHGQQSTALDGGGLLSSITCTNSAVTATNTILFSMEFETGVVVQNRPANINETSRSAGVSFDIEGDWGGIPLSPVIVNYIIIG